MASKLAGTSDKNAKWLATKPTTNLNLQKVI